MWYAVGVWFRNLLFNLGIKRQTIPPITTIGIGNLCAGGVGKTPHAEYILRLLSDQYSTALLSRGYRRKSRGFQMDDGTHSVALLGDEPAMMAYKFPQVKVAVCESRVEGIDRLLAQENPPQVVVMDDVYQHRYVKPTINILLTEYAQPYCKDHILPYGDLREFRGACRRANIVIVTKSPETLNPIDKHNMIASLKLQPYQKLFFSYIHYCDPLPLTGGAPLSLSHVDGVLALTGIAHPEPMLQYLRSHCQVTPLRYGDHHNFTLSDMKHIRKAFEHVKGTRKIVLTTEKDAVRLRDMAGHEAMAGLPVYYLPIEIRIHQKDEYSFDQTISNIVKENVLFQHKMKTATFNLINW